MTILFVTHYSGFYGANRSLHTLMLLLREKYGVQPIVLLPTDGPMCAQLEKEGIPYKVSHYYWWVNENHGAFQWLLNKRKQLRNYMRIPKLCRLFKGYHFDLVYTNSVCANVGVFIAERFGLPHIWQPRESLTQFAFQLSLSTSLSKRIWALPVNKVYILISDYMKEAYRRYLPNDRMVKIYNGVDLPKGVEERTMNAINGRLKVVSSGIISLQKNQLELLQAQVLLRQRGIEIETYFLGTNKPDYLALLQQYVNGNHIEDLVHFVGHTDDVFGMLNDMNLGVVTSHDEAFGRVTIEYMLMHIPVVVSDSGANSELIDERNTGKIYHLGNIGQLADYIEEYVKNPELLQKQGDAAAKEAREKFSAEKNAELIYEQIKKAIKK